MRCAMVESARCGGVGRKFLAMWMPWSWVSSVWSHFQPMGTTLETEHLAYRYRLMPTPAQEQLFLRISGCCRLVFNKALEAHQAAYAETQQ